MTGLVRKATLLSVCGLFVAGAAMASVPSPDLSIVGKVMKLVGASSGVLSTTVGDYTVTVHHTPGHCPGGVCLQIGRTGDTSHLFVGDTLFAGSIGRTDLPGGDYGVLMKSITGVLFPLGDDSVVHPGHGPDTTIGIERRTNPFLT